MDRHEIHRKRSQFLDEIGLNSLDAKKWSIKWNNLKKHAPSRGVRCNLSFEEYVTLAKNAGINSPDEIGKGSEEYQMGRIGDVGDYEIGNCRFITHNQNMIERKLNGGHEIAVEKTSRKLRGRDKKNHSGPKFSSELHSKEFILMSPDGDIFKGKNLKEFCETNELNQGHMASVCRGDRKHHKGWTGSYI